MATIQNRKQSLTMSEDSEMWNEYKADQRKRRDERLPIRQKEIEVLADIGFKVEKKTEFHYRIDDTYDLWPIHNRWHNIKTNKRGGAKNLAEFIKSKTPNPLNGNRL